MSKELDNEYRRIRRNLQKSRRYYLKKGYSESKLPKIPSVPKKVTEASIRRLENIIVSPERRKITKEYGKLLTQYGVELKKASNFYADATHRGKHYSEIPEQLGNITIQDPTKATKKGLEELKREVKKAKTYNRREEAKFIQKHPELKTIKKEKPKPKKKTKEPEEVLPKPLDPYDDSYWEDWEEGPPRNYEAEEKAVIENLKQSHPEMFYPSEEDVVTDNVEETLIDYGLYDLVEEQLEGWEPSNNWSEGTQIEKAKEVQSALSIFRGAVSRDGKAAVAERLNDFSGDIQIILESICFVSNQPDMVRFNLTQFSSIVNGKAVSYEDNMKLTESTDYNTSYW